MLATLLQEELAAIEALRQLLQREYEALKSRDLPHLEQIIHAKQTCSERVQDLVAKRLNYLREQGFTADAPGLAAYVKAATPAEQVDVDRLWAELERIAAQTRHQNEINGAVIAASRNHVARALAILRGRDPLDFLYNQETHKIPGGGNNRPIAKA